MTLEEALEDALSHWQGRPGEVTMYAMAKRGVEAMGASKEVSKLTPKDAIACLLALRSEGLSAKYVGSVYGALRRVVTLAGHGSLMQTWPKAPAPPRKVRDRLPPNAALEIEAWLTGRGWKETADLVALIAATGMRINVEGLKPGSSVQHVEDGVLILTITGKGGHERQVPVVSEEVAAIVSSPERMRAMQRTGYRTHLRRFHTAVKSLGITSRLATPHALRHSFGSDVLENSGGNLAMAQELLGHASPATTALYMHPARADQLAALRGRPKETS